jgi:hypothetical protein
MRINTVTTWTVYETRFFGPTDNRGSRVKVTNTKLENYRWHHWDYSAGNGLDQHREAVWRNSYGDVQAVNYGGQTKQGYLWVVERKEED